MGLKRSKSTSNPSIFIFAPYMGLKSQFSGLLIEDGKFAPYMGLKSILLGVLQSVNLFAPYMGLKSVAKHRKIGGF